MLSTKLVHYLPLLAGLVSLASANRVNLKQATRASILDRASRQHRKRAAPSTTPPPTSIGDYYLQGEIDGYRGHSPSEGFLGPPYVDQANGFGSGTYTFSQALSACQQQADTASDGSFNLFYTPSNDAYFCFSYEGTYNAQGLLDTVDGTVTNSYAYSQG